MTMGCVCSRCSVSIAFLIVGRSAVSGVIDARAVLIAHVATLLIERRRINRQEVELKELAEAYLIGSIGDVYGFGKARSVATHFLIAGAGGMAIGVATSVEMTPRTCLKKCSVPQKQPPANRSLS